ncbi:MAG: aminotransferase class IV [Mucilaginibacter polytrichastri]|nr:aminotransferase class IV [Mucilaginibacter polytrichastri]
MSTFINFNGQIVPAGNAVLKASNRAFRYGDSLFESMRLMRGHLNFADMHAERLQKGMKKLHLDGYSQLDAYFLRENALELAARNKCGKHARIRISVFRDAEGLYTPSQNTSGFVMEATRLDESWYTSNTRGLIMDIYEELPKAINTFSNLKTGSALNYVMAGIFKKRNNLDEAFILNDKGNLCESISANVFVWYDKQLFTPALSEGCIAGVMRQVVMKLAAEQEIPVIEAEISPEILREAEEVFLTNATQGIRWAMGYGNKRYFNEISRMLTARLNDHVKRQYEVI